MIRIEIKESENIERALKRYKRKRLKLKIRDELKSRQHYTKKSDKRRVEIQKARYRSQFLNEEENKKVESQA